MLVNLSSRGLRALSQVSATPFIGRISEEADVNEATRGREILIVRRAKPLLPGFCGYLVEEPIACDGLQNVFLLDRERSQCAHGDVVRIDPLRRTLHTLYRRTSPSNAFLVTERCDNLCVMCSQPPKDHDDSWIARELLEVISLVSPETCEIGITGGEPALLGDQLLEIVRVMRDLLPRTGVHILSNGRRFADVPFAQALGRLRHPDLMMGIPVYSDLPEEHDFVVQARGAFDETIRGVLALKRARVRIELRFVIHAETYRRLPEFAEFISRNLRFVDHVALMGLELMGFARTNVDTLWVDPLDYQGELLAATRTLDRAGLRTSIYNHQLCTLPEALHPFARKSISDWKNVYFDECAPCTKRDECGGFFASSSLRRSRGIKPITCA